MFLFKVYYKFTTGRDKSSTCLIGKTAIVTGANTGNFVIKFKIQIKTNLGKFLFSSFFIKQFDIFYIGCH